MTELESRKRDVIAFYEMMFNDGEQRADEMRKSLPSGTHRHPRNMRIIPKSRDFH